MAWRGPALCPDCGDGLRRGRCEGCGRRPPEVLWTPDDGGLWRSVGRLVLALLYLVSCGALGIGMWALLFRWQGSGALRALVLVLTLPPSAVVALLFAYLGLVHPFERTWRYQSVDGRRRGTAETLYGRVRSVQGTVVDGEREPLEAPPEVSSVMVQRAGARLVRRALRAELTLDDERWVPNGPSLLALSALLYLQGRGYLSLEGVYTVTWTRSGRVVKRSRSPSGVEVSRTEAPVLEALPWLEARLLAAAEAQDPGSVPPQGLSLPYRAVVLAAPTAATALTLQAFLVRALEGAPRPGRAVVEGVRADPTGAPQVALQALVERLRAWRVRDPEFQRYFAAAFQASLRG